MSAPSLPAGSVRVKICGITRAEDARSAASLGADYLGLVCAPSPRQLDLGDTSWISEVRSEFPAVQWVGVFVNPEALHLQEIIERLRLDLVQLHLAEPGPVVPTCPWIWATSPAAWTGPGGRLAGLERSGSASPFAVLVDTPDPDRAGGTGRTFDWSVIASAAQSVRLFVAGGLDAENVGRAIAVTRPFAVDASSRLEMAPGIKDPRKLAAFFASIERARSRLASGAAANMAEENPTTEP